MNFRLGYIEMDWMTNSNGVCQGCTMSPTLFIHKEEPITKMRTAEVGVQVGSGKLGCLGYTNVVLMVENKEDTERLTQITSDCRKDRGDLEQQKM